IATIREVPFLFGKEAAVLITETICALLFYRRAEILSPCVLKKMLSVHANEERQNEIENSAIKMLPGFVTALRVRCGKANCRCARGDRHLAHYHVTYCGGVRARRYVRHEDVQAMLAACEAHRDLQAKLRAGRAEYKQLLAQTRNLAKLIGSE